MSDELLREEAENMCKMMASSNYALQEHEDLDNIEDKRIHATMYSVNATNLFKACLAGVRRQKYWMCICKAVRADDIACSLMFI